ncbi:MarR family winged helix-turn-helix transcriptional regulator [Pediococcus acidilactici]
MKENIVLSNKEIDIARLINILNKAEFNVLSKRFRDLNISDVQALVIISIFNSKTEIHQKDLERQFDVSNPTMTQSIQSMKKKELITKTKSQADGRYYALTLTDKGRKLYPKCMAIYTEIQSIIDSVLSEAEKKALISSMNTLIKAFKEY